MGCKHKAAEHTPNHPRSCKRATCRCSEFSSRFTCSCGGFWGAHDTVFESAAERAQLGLDSGLTSLAALVDGVDRLPPTRRPDGALGGPAPPVRKKLTEAEEMDVYEKR